MIIPTNPQDFMIHRRRGGCWQASSSLFLRRRLLRGRGLCLFVRFKGIKLSVKSKEIRHDVPGYKMAIIYVCLIELP